jgi:NADH-quinone oxidoreductase subunit A
MHLQYSTVLIFLLVGAGFVIFNLLLGRLIRPNNPTPEKLIPYECGEEPVGPAWVQFNMRFYIIALCFLIFDVEIVFLFPWGVVFRDLGLFAFVEMLIFIFILVVGFAYIWAKGDLRWVRPKGAYEVAGASEPSAETAASEPEPSTTA